MQKWISAIFHGKLGALIVSAPPPSKESPGISCFHSCRLESRVPGLRPRSVIQSDTVACPGQISNEPKFSSSNQKLREWIPTSITQKNGVIMQKLTTCL